MYSFLTQDLYDRLLQNGLEQRELSSRDDWKDHTPVVLLYLPNTEFKWLLTELDPDNPSIAFGLCDLGMGFPETGSVSLSELEEARHPFGLKVLRDTTFKTEKSLGYFEDLAHKHRKIILSEETPPSQPDRGR